LTISKVKSILYTVSSTDTVIRTSRIRGLHLEWIRSDGAFGCLDAWRHPLRVQFWSLQMNSALLLVGVCERKAGEQSWWRISWCL